MSGGSDSTKWWTTDHDLIRRWADERDVVPVAFDRGDGERVLRLEPADDHPGERLRWPEFFDRFEDERLALLYRNPGATEGADADHAWQLLDRDAVDDQIAAAEKTSDPADADTNQFALSDTGDAEPVAYDRTGRADEEPTAKTRTDDASPRPRQKQAQDVDESAATEASTAATGDKRRGPTDRADHLVLDEIREADAGPVLRDDGYLKLVNTGDDRIDISGWRVRNESGRTYRFPDGATLDPEQQLVLYSGDGDDAADQNEYYWDAEDPVWHAGGDTVVVETPSGEPVVEETYKGGQ